MAIFLLLRIERERALLPPSLLCFLLFNFRVQETRQRTPVQKFRAVNSRHSTGFPRPFPVQQHRREKGSEFSADENRWTEYRSPSTEAGIIFVDCGRRRRRKLVVGRIGEQRG